MKHVSQRGVGKYNLLQLTKEMCVYTLRITQNERFFPKRYRLAMVNKIQDRALYVLTCFNMAAEIYPRNKMELDRRIAYVKEGKGAVRTLMTLMEIGGMTFNIKPKRVRNWTAMCSDVYVAANAWIEEDLERFSHLL